MTGHPMERRMDAFDIAILMPFARGSAAPFATPFGEVSCEPWGTGGRAAVVLGPAPDPRAAPWAARALGATRLVVAGAGAALNRLLRPCDWVLPDDYVDQTRGLPTTYFAERGLGYVQQTPPFCPEMREALAGIPESRTSRVFERGTYVSLPSPRTETPAEAGWWRRLGGDVAGWGVLPAVTLAHELELCVAPVCYLTREAAGEDETWLAPSDADTLLAALLATLPVERHCHCGETMAGARARGLINADWWQRMTP